MKSVQCEASPTILGHSVPVAALMGALCVAVIPVQVAAQKIEPVGASIAGIKANLALDAAVFYDSNIYASGANSYADVIGKLSPSAQLTADTSRFFLSLGAGATRFEYADQADENRTDWHGDGKLEVEPLRATFIRLRGAYRHLHEDRGSPDSPVGAINPTAYDLLTGGVSLSRELGRLQAVLELDHSDYDYRNGERGNASTINNDDRDRKRFTGGAEIRFEISPGYSVFSRAELSRIRYRLDEDDDGYDRDSKGLKAIGGVKFGLSNLLEGDIYAGYLGRKFEDTVFADVSDVTFGAGLTWHPSRLTRISLNADRSVEETTQADYKGFLQTSAAIRVEHELTRTLTLIGGGRYSENDYLRRMDESLPGEGAISPSRLDKMYMANAGLRYALNRNMAVDLGYDWTQRASNAAASDYQRHKATLSFSLKL